MKEMHSRPIAEKRENGDAPNNGNGEDGQHGSHNIAMESSRMPFLMLGLDLPPPPLFKDVMEKNIIPQVCFFKFKIFIVIIIGNVLPFFLFFFSSSRIRGEWWSSYLTFFIPFTWPF